MKPRGKWSITAPALSLTGPTLKLSNRPVDKIEFLANGNLMVATSTGDKNQKTYSIWDMNDRHQIKLIEAPAAFSEEGKIAYCSQGKGVQVMGWRNNTLEVLHEFEYISGNCKTIQFLKHTEILSAITDTGTITLWDVTSGTELHRILGGDGKYTRAALSPDETRLAAGTEKGIIRVWDLASGNILQQLGKKGFGSKGQVHDLAFTADGAKIVTSQSNAMACWDIHTGQIIYSQTPAMSLGHFLPNAMGGGLILGTSSNPAQKQLLVRDIQTGKPNSQFKKLNGQFVWSYELSPDKNIVFMAQGGKVALYDLPQATVMRTQRVNQLNTWVPALVISPDGILNALTFSLVRRSILASSKAEDKKMIPLFLACADNFLKSDSESSRFFNIWYWVFDPGSFFFW